MSEAASHPSENGLALGLQQNTSMLTDGALWARAPGP